MMAIRFYFTVKQCDLPEFEMVVSFLWQAADKLQGLSESMIPQTPKEERPHCFTKLYLAC